VYDAYLEFLIKGFTLKSDGANIHYVGDGHCSFLGIFVCGKKTMIPKKI
jgi:hypothetical protein